jgi:short-subunit dehydrogenase
LAIHYADKWGLITGASSGIGAEFARRLAARGMHLVLTARREEHLRELATELHTRHGTKTHIIAGDLSDPTFPVQLYEAVRDAGVEVSLLVNNAGFGDVSTVLDTNPDKLLQMIRLNIGALTELTYRYLPEMIRRQEGQIVNVSSVAAFQPVAYMPVYSASKAYVLHFSEALWAECRDYGVTVMAICPGTTRTDFFDIAGVGGWLKRQRSQSTEQVVKTALKYLGKRRQYAVSGWLNYLISLAPRLGPRWIVVQETTKYFRPAVTKPADEKPTQK